MSPFTEGLIIFAVEIMFLFSFGLALFIFVNALFGIYDIIKWVVNKWHTEER